MEGLREIMMNLSGWPVSGRDLNPGTPEYEGIIVIGYKRISDCRRIISSFKLTGKCRAYACIFRALTRLQ
jgi:hypothetical protein